MKISKFVWLAALVAVAAVLGAVAYSPEPATAATGNKTCNGSAAVTTTECDLSITLGPGMIPAASVVTITVTLGAGPTQFTGFPTPPTVTSTGACFPGTTAFVGGVTPSSYDITVTTPAGGGCPVGTTFTINEPVNVSASGTVIQTVTFVPIATDVPFATIATPVFFVAPANAISASKTCGAGPALAPPGSITCTLTITNNTAITDVAGPDYQVVISGPGTITGPASSSITVSDPTCFTFLAGTPAATSYQLELGVLNCPAGSTITVTEFITPSAGGVLSQTVTRADGATATATASIGAQFRAGTTFIIRCPAALNPDLTAAFPLVVPGPIGGTTPIAIGVLPATLICEALFVNAAGEPERVAPGTIEISSLNGTLVDLRGGLSTNLRIGCDAAASVSGTEAIVVDVNTCQGVRFGVIGLGVGFVELRARYEPSSAAAAAGIQEREASATVAFIAPPVSVSLLLNPNPVGVGADGTATLRFNRTFVIGDVVLINPQTGAPLSINLGSVLNGTVTFVSSNPAVAAFTGGVSSTEQVVTGTADLTVAETATVSVRCGSPTPATAQGLVVSAAQFANFFGGCGAVSAQYRGKAIGTTQITGAFVGDLPGAFGAAGVLAGNVQALVSQFGAIAVNQQTRTLEVVQAIANTQRLVPGCNNVVAPASETVQQVAARVDPASAAISIWKQVPGTTQFQGAAVGGNVPASVSNLASVNALDAIFICVNAAATYRIN